MKRKNPKTGKPYKRGEKNEEGLLYYATDGYAALDENGYGKALFYSKDEYDRKIGLHRTNRVCYLSQFDGFIKSRLNRAKERARRKKIKFSVTEEYLKSIYPSNGLCPIFKIKMEFLGDHLNSASLDRIDNEKGYEKGNVRWICMRANRVKGTATDEEILALADFIRSDK